MSVTKENCDDKEIWGKAIKEMINMLAMHVDKDKKNVRIL